MMRNIILLAISLVAAATAVAQEKKIETTVSADVVNQYIWRGQDLGNASVQPTLAVGWKGLSLTAWGSVGLTESSDTKELDLTAQYTAGGLTIGVTDYWFNTPEERYFLYDAHCTSHVFEAFAGYDFGTISATWYTNFAGNDGTNKDGKRAYSSYVEASVPFGLSSAHWTATIGAVPFATTSYGTTGFAVTNVSLRAEKAVRMTDTFTLPVFVQLTANPCAQRTYLVFGFTLSPD